MCKSVHVYIICVTRRQTILTTMHLHYTVDNLYKWEGWMVTKEDDEAFGYIANEGDSLCPLGLNGGWEYQLSSGWEADTTMDVTCGDDGPQPTDGPGPTDGQDTTTSDQPTVPGPGGMQPTIVAIKVGGSTGHWSQLTQPRTLETDCAGQRRVHCGRCGPGPGH